MIDDSTLFPLAWRRTPLPNADPGDCYVCDQDGAQIVRVMKVEHGPQAGSWRWTARTQHLPNQGTEPTLEAARATAKRRWEEDPMDLGAPRSRQEKRS